MTRSVRILRTLLVLGCVSAVVAVATYAAFGATTTSASNSFTAGTVTVSDNDAGSAVAQIAAAEPGASTTGCIAVTYTGSLDATQDQCDAWYVHWVTEGLAALEALAAPRAGAFLFGDSLTLADVMLVPQLYNARRFAVPIAPYPSLRCADESASALPAFAAAHPDKIAQQDMVR